MTGSETRLTVTEAQLAHLGEGQVAYLRKVSSDDLRGRFPGLTNIAPGLEVWALFAANGQPILLSDERDRALAGAFENELVPVSIH
ncbi:hypothetical protein MesoLjLc_02950 [Mesorhizobium sp. L-8-10]|uniref:BQ00720 family protein n=1 Tax=unclassified Mesorhizobium TaxID=325217 RepID=UPI0019266C7F|nr:MULTISPECIES: DUF1150 family protein [unclassified Mesorhizobium]BCH20510.1 hypothetical protein MesoLjLb_02950 [Mesorhizobium sp. L-8-3]BCH28365.1 hypothetical protein MesoLjLc_02950 [Mesorhizobium sp. L-8-10]